MWYLSYSFPIIKLKSYLLTESKPRVQYSKKIFTAPTKFSYKVFIDTAAIDI